MSGDAVTTLTTQDVELMPEKLENGVIYVSEKYQIAIHLCACGCGMATVTPFNKPEGWDLTRDSNGITLRPSIGNMQFPCGSHYYVTDGDIQHV